jgi:hypothetical protein
MFSGSGCDALGGSDAVVPCPGALSGRAPPVWIWFAPETTGISSSWFCRTERSGPSPFQEASAVTDTP